MLAPFNKGLRRAMLHSGKLEYLGVCRESHVLRLFSKPPECHPMDFRKSHVPNMECKFYQHGKIALHESDQRSLKGLARPYVLHTCTNGALGQRAARLLSLCTDVQEFSNDQNPDPVSESL